MPATQASVIETIEREAHRRFVRWNSALWREMTEGPLEELTQGLSGAKSNRGRKVAEAYLKLCAQGIGLGYLFPSNAGVQSFFTLAFRELLPRHLPKLDDSRQSQALAQCWNLAENLEQSPPWLRQIFLKLCDKLESLAGLEALVAEVSSKVFEPPARKLAQSFTAQWVHLGEDDKRFLPGRIEFLAPTVVRVFDRKRDGRDGAPPVTIGVWLAETPVALGPIGGESPPGAPQDEDEALWSALTRQDVRFTPAFDAARNEWRACATLMTSQMMVVLNPVGA